MSILKKLLGVAAVLLAVSTAPATATTTTTIAPTGTTGTYSTNVRGYWFTAPVDFVITGLDVPTTASTGSIYAAILLMNTAIPTYSSTTTNYSVLAEVRNSATGVSNLAISVSAGDIIGVLGYRGGVNAYVGGPQTVDIFGFATVLNRFGTQNSLVTNSVAGLPVWTENGGSLSAVYLTVSSSLPAVPLPASAPMLLAGLGLVATLRKRKGKAQLA